MIEGYEILETGEIVSDYLKGQKMRPHTTATGYKRITLRVWDGEKRKAKTFYVHRLVAEAHIPNPENKPEINHIDGDKSNNHYTNLEWSSRKENINHAYDNGFYDEKRKDSRKLDWKDIQEIRKQPNKYSLRGWAKILNVHMKTIWNVIKGNYYIDEL